MFPTPTAKILGWFVLLAGLAALADGTLLVGPERADAPSVEALARAVLRSPAEPPSGALPDLLGSSASAPEPAKGQRPGAGRAAQSDLRGLEAPQGSLDHFYESLEATASRRPGAMTRVLHWGDSMLTGDAISGAVRGVLQTRFGRGGHGFILPGRPWHWYHHQGVNGWNSEGFRINRVTANPLSDGRLGLGGVALRTFQGGARVTIEPVDGERVSRYEVFSLGQPRGGQLILQAGGDPITVSTRAESVESRFDTIEAASSTARLTITYGGGGEVRLFGVTVELVGPGVVYDSLGINGLHAANFRRFDRAHLAEQVRHRAPALIVVMLGTNESQNVNLDLERHGEDYREMLDRVRAGAPDASCLVVAPPDRATRGWRGSDLIARIVGRQREVGLEAGCAFWNTYEIMGGAGAAARWRRLRPPLIGGDLTHPTPDGAERLGASLGRALVAGYERWHRGAPPARASNELDSGASGG